MTISGMDASQFISVVEGAFTFRSTIATLVLGGYGFAAARMWPENSPLSRARIWFLVPGLLVLGIVLWRVADEYNKLASAIASDTLLAYAPGALARMPATDGWLVGASVWLCFVIGLRRP